MPIDTGIFADFGTLVGGLLAIVFGLYSVILIIKSIDQQAKQNALQNIESRFFELVKLHRENISQFNVKEELGRNVFVLFYNEFSQLTELIKVWYPSSQINDQREWNRKVTEISYLILFFGLKKETYSFLQEKIKEVIGDNGYYEKKVLPYILDPLKRTFDNEMQNDQKKDIKYSGYQAILGHYFRHLFQSLKYINQQPSELLAYESKYSYIKLLRAQLSTHEQAIIFFNSLTFLGRKWEFDVQDDNNKLLTKYNFIKNIPKGFTGTIDPKYYYPNIYYEFDNSKASFRIELEKKYT